jgi:hypothetical protein
MSRTAIILAASVWIALAVNPARSNADPAYIGSATMSADGTITLHLNRTADGQFLDGTLTYRVGDPDYRETLDHIGQLKPGETRPVRPWPEK